MFSSVNKKLLFLQLILLIIFLFLTPVLIEGARQRFAYSSYAVAEYILHTGSTDPQLISYSNWPSFQIFTAIFIMITGVDINFLIPISSSFLTALLMFLPLYFFFKVVTNNDLKVWLLLWSFYLANWVSRDFLSSQAFGFILFILIFALVILFVNKNSNNDIFKGSNRPIIVLIIVLFIAVVTGHLLSAIVPIGILFVLYVTKWFNRKNIMFSLVAIVAGWTVYATAGYLRSNFLTFLSKLLNFLPNTLRNVNKTGSVSQIGERVLTNEMKIVYMAIFIMFAFIYLFIAYRRKSLDRTDKLLLCSLVGILLLSFLPYGGELFTRLWLFSLPIIVFFAVKNVDNRKIFAVFAIFIILFAPPMFIWARYGEETYDYIPQSELSGSNFLHSVVPSGFFIGGTPWIRTQNGYDVYHRQGFDFIKNKGNFTLALAYTRTGLIDNGNSDPLYLIVNRGNSEYHRRLYNEPQLFVDFSEELSNSTLFNKVYSNPNFEMYGSTR
jgi:hypothetical protein